MVLKYKRSFVITMEREIAKYNSLVNAQRSAKKVSETKPILRQPTSPVYETLSKEMGVSSHAIDVIWDAIRNEPHPALVNELKKVFMLAKLYYPNASLQIQKAMNEARDRYEATLANIEKAKTDYIEITEKIGKFELIEEFKIFKGHWKDVIDQLYAECVAVDFHLEKLDFESQILARTIEHRSKFFNRVSGTDKINADWEHIREHLKVEHIRSIIREFSEAYDSKLLKFMETELKTCLAESLAEDGFVMEEINGA